MSTKVNPMKAQYLYAHLPQDLTDFQEYLNGLTVDDLVEVSMLHGANRHDCLNLSSNRKEILVSGKTENMVRKFAGQHGISMVGALDILLWSGLNYRHGKDLPHLPTQAKTSTLPEEIKPDGKTKGRPKSGQGQPCSIRLTPMLEEYLTDYGVKYGNLLRKWMKQYVDNPVLFKDSTAFQLDDGRNNRPQLRVSFLPWQLELLKEIESAFGCTRSQALMKILVALEVP